jgi:hypothetical protein
MGIIPKQISTIETHIYQGLDENEPPKAMATSTACTARFARRILSVLGNPEQEESYLLNITMQHSVNDILFLFYQFKTYIMFY